MELQSHQQHYFKSHHLDKQMSVPFASNHTNNIFFKSHHLDKFCFKSHEQHFFKSHPLDKQNTIIHLMDVQHWYSVVLSDVGLYGLQMIGRSAFYNCSFLGSIIISSSVISIRCHAFSGCTIIPPSVASTADDACYGCAGIFLVQFKLREGIDSVKHVLSLL